MIILDSFFPFLILTAPLIFLFRKQDKSVAAMIAIVLGGLLTGAGSVVAIIQGGCSYLPGLDRLGAVFTLAIAIVGVSSSIYSVGFIRKSLESKSDTQISLHFSSLVILFYSMIAVITSSTEYEFMLWWELMTLSSFLLVIFEASRKEVLHAGISYLILMHISFFFLLSAFSMDDSTQLWSGSISPIMWLVFLIGFGLKSALFPLHIWLPVTYLNTPSHVGALMSGVMINMGIYGILRTTLLLEDPYVAGIILFAVGIVSGVFGIVKAALHTGIKRLLAYSSIENMGIITMAIGLGAVGKALGSDTLMMCGIGGALLHTLNHSSYKCLLFMGAGSIVWATGKSDLNRMGGLLRTMPITGWTFLIGSLAICAIPPFSGFVSEFVIFSGMFDAVSTGTEPVVGIVGIMALALISGLAILTFSKAFGITFAGQARSCSVRDAREVNTPMIIALVVPLVSILFGGMLFPYIILTPESAIFEQILSIYVVMGAVIGVICALWAIRWFLQRGRRIEQAPTWGCAFTSVDKKMQYTSSSFSRELNDVAAAKLVDDPNRMSIDVFPGPRSFATKHSDRANRVVTSTSQRFLHRWTARLALFQTGKTNHYILHALLFLVLILILSMTNAI